MFLIFKRLKPILCLVEGKYLRETVLMYQSFINVKKPSRLEKAKWLFVLRQTVCILKPLHKMVSTWNEFIEKYIDTTIEELFKNQTSGKSLINEQTNSL
jgi:hypothetical protein